MLRLVLGATATLLISASAVAQTPPRDAVQPPGKGIVRGRALLAENGQPLRRVQIRLSTGNGGSRASLTDDNGRYEFRDVPGGHVELMPAKGGYVAVVDGARRRVEQQRTLSIRDGEVLEKVDFVFVRGGVATGRIVDETGEPMTGVGVQLLRPRYLNGQRTFQGSGFGSTDDRGEFRVFGVPPGDYYVAANYQRNFDDVDDFIEYATTYFPGTSNRTEAQRVTIAPGAEVSGLNLQMQRTRSTRIQGVVRAADGRPMLGTMVTMLAKDGDALGQPRSALVQPDGSFTLTGVAPGTYTLTATNVLNAARETARTEITVAGGDVSGVVLALRPGVTARGRVVFERTPDGINAADIRVATTGTDSPSFTSDRMPPTVNDDWTFELKGLSGRQLLAAVVLRPDAPWVSKAVRVGGTDVTDIGIDFGGDFGGDDVDGIEIVMTDKLSSVTGLVTGDDGRPGSNATVILFSDDAERWRLRDRYVVAARPDQEGRYEIPWRPAGRYRAIAVDDVDQGEEQDPELLAAWRERATLVELKDGESKTVDLRVIARFSAP